MLAAGEELESPNGRPATLYDKALIAPLAKAAGAAGLAGAAGPGLLAGAVLLAGFVVLVVELAGAPEPLEPPPEQAQLKLNIMSTAIVLRAHLFLNGFRRIDGLSINNQ